MDIATLFRALWQFKITSIVVIALTLVAAGGMLKLTPPTYTAMSSYLVISPPDPPTDAQIKADPALRNVNYENPYNRYGGDGVILDVVAHTATSDKAIDKIVAAGGDHRFTVAPEATFGAGSSILDITVTADSGPQALRTLGLVSDSVVQDLQQVQADEKVDPRWMFTTRLISKPTNASPVYSGTLRAVVGVMVLGGIVLIVALSLRMGAAARRRPRLAAALGADVDDLEADGGTGAARQGKTDGVLETRHYRKAAL